MNEPICFRRDCRCAAEAQQYMIDRIREFPWAEYDTRITVDPKEDHGKIQWIVIGERRAEPR